MRIKPIELRKRMRGLSVGQLAKLAHVQPETIYGNLRSPERRVRWNTVWRIAQILECEIGEIAWVREYVRVEEDIERDRGLTY